MDRSAAFVCRSGLKVSVEDLHETLEMLDPGVEGGEAEERRDKLHGVFVLGRLGLNRVVAGDRPNFVGRRVSVCGVVVWVIRKNLRLDASIGKGVENLVLKRL